MNSTTIRKRKVSFGGTRVFRVVRVPADVKPDVWYNGKELESLVAAEMESMKDCDLRQCSSSAVGAKQPKLKQVMPSLSLMGSKYHHKSHGKHTCESHTPRGLEKYHTNTRAHHHVHRVLTLFQAQLQQHKGGWEPQSLRRVSQNMSKDDIKAALKRAKQDCSAVYGSSAKQQQKESSQASSSNDNSSSKIGASRLMAMLNRAA